jgi:uncharacterized protein (DUF305 family)
MRNTLSIATLVLLALACSKEHHQDATATVATETAAPVQAPAAPYDLQFIDTMSKHHQAAVDMAKMAQGKITNKSLKALVAKIPGDQQKEIDQMKAWRDQWYSGAPPAENMQMPGMSASMNMDMSHMQTMKPGKDYDLMFIDMMIPHHEGAVTMSQEALAKAEHPEIKTLAQQIITAQTKEIDDMKRWKTALAK